MQILLVSIGVAALALFLVVLPVIGLQLALRLFTASSVLDEAPLCDRRSLELVRAS